MINLTALVIAAVIGYLIGHFIANKLWYKTDGVLIVSEEENAIRWKLQYNGDPYELPTKKTVTFKIEVEE